MLKLFSLCIVGLVMTACQTTNLQGGAYIGYEKYLKVENHKAFFVYQGAEGGFSWAYSKGRASRMEAFEAAKARCDAQGKKYAFKECQPYFIDDIKVSSMSKQEIAQLLVRNNQIATGSSADVYVRTLDLNGTWENISTNVTGSISLTKDKGTGPFKLQIQDAACTGAWHYSRGQYGTDIPSEGTWSVVCTDSKSASGTYRSFKEGVGQAKGTDNYGNKLDIFFSRKANVEHKKVVTSANQVVIDACSSLISNNSKASRTEAREICICAAPVYGNRLAQANNTSYKPDLTLEEEIAHSCPKVFKRWKELRS